MPRRGGPHVRSVPMPPPSEQGTTRGCRGKRAHPTWRDAATAAAQVRRRTGDDSIRPYRCDECAYWHAGHDRFWKPAH